MSELVQEASTEPPFLSIVVPFLNEQGNVHITIGSVIDALRGFDFKYEIVCVDNGSTDGTYSEILEAQQKHAGIKLVTVPVNFGFGAGLLLGFVAARGTNVGYIWGDHQIPQDTITRCVASFLQNPQTVVKGARKSRAESLWRKIVSKIYNRSVRILFGVKEQDMNSAPKIFPFNPLQKLSIRSTDWFIDPEIVILLNRHRIPIIEIPFEPLKREKGVSKVSAGTIFQFLANLAAYKLTGTPLRPIYSFSFTRRNEELNANGSGRAPL